MIRGGQTKVQQHSAAVKTGSHFHLCSKLQSNTAVSILASCDGKTRHPHCGGSGGVFSLHLHHCFLLFGGPEKPACAAKPSRLAPSIVRTYLLRVIVPIRPKEQTFLNGLFSE